MVRSKTNTIFVVLIIYCITIEVAYCGTSKQQVNRQISRPNSAKKEQNSSVNKTGAVAPAISSTSSWSASVAPVLASTSSWSFNRFKSFASNAVNSLANSATNIVNTYIPPATRDEICYNHIMDDLYCSTPLICINMMFEKKTLDDLNPSTQSYVKYLYGRITKGNPCLILEQLFFYTKIRTIEKSDDVPYEQTIACKTSTFKNKGNGDNSQNCENEENYTKIVDVYEFKSKDKTQYVKYMITKLTTENVCSSLSRIFYGTKLIDTPGFNLQNAFVNSLGILKLIGHSLVSSNTVAPSLYCDEQCTNQVPIAFNYCEEPLECFTYAFLYMIKKDNRDHADAYFDHLKKFMFIKKSALKKKKFFSAKIFCEELTDSQIKAANKYAGGIVDEDVNTILPNTALMEFEILTCKTDMIYAKLDEDITTIVKDRHYITKNYAEYVLDNISLNYISRDYKYAGLFVQQLMEIYVGFKKTPETQDSTTFCKSRKTIANDVNY